MNETLAMLKTNSAGFCIKRDRKTERSILLKGVIRLPDGIPLVVEHNGTERESERDAVSVRRGHAVEQVAHARIDIARGLLVGQHIKLGRVEQSGGLLVGQHVELGRRLEEGVAAGRQGLEGRRGGRLAQEVGPRERREGDARVRVHLTSTTSTDRANGVGAVGEVGTVGLQPAVGVEQLEVVAEGGAHARGRLQRGRLGRQQ